MIECGHCHVGCGCHNSYGRNRTLTRYYCCRNHDLLRAGSEDRLCPERNIRANELDEYVFEQVRQALLTPDQLLAAERAVLTGAPDENELVAAQLKRLDTAIEAKERERARLLDAYQAGLLVLEELTRRTGVLATRRTELTREKETLTQRSAELAAQNRMRRRLAGFSARVPPPGRPGPSHRQAMSACVPIIEMAHEGVPLVVIQRQLGHANLGITSIYLQGIDSGEISAWSTEARHQTISATAALQLRR